MILLPVVILSMAQAFFFIRWRSLALAFGSIIVFSCFINSVKMIYQRNFGLRDRISELERQYDDKRDVVQVLNIATREALRIYSTKELNHFVIRRSSDHDLAFRLIEENTKGKERLWVLEFPRKDSVLKTKKWKSFEKNRFYNFRNNKLAMFGYTLPVMLSEKQMDL
ncbi:MAG: hypothetical protein ACE5GN_02580 [Waddliaceae bacterium]